MESIAVSLSLSSDYWTEIEANFEVKSYKEFWDKVSFKNSVVWIFQRNLQSFRMKILSPFLQYKPLTIDRKLHFLQSDFLCRLLEIIYLTYSKYNRNVGTF